MRTLLAAVASICILFSAQATVAQNNSPDGGQKIMVFTAQDQDLARAAATNWVNDRSKHAGIYLRKFTVVQEGDKFVATITYEDVP